MPGRMLLVAGGTGGHVLPAVAFGRWVSENHPSVDVGYMSGTRPMELDIYRASSIKPMTVSMEGSPFGAPRGRRVKRWLDLIGAFHHAGALIRNFAPDICVMFGGYISAPALVYSRIKGIRSVMHEQNASAGRVTRLARTLGVPVASGWEVCAPFGRSDFTFVGVPIRGLRIMDRDAAWRSLDLPGRVPDGPIVVVMTGSLGSVPVRDIITALAQRDEFLDWTFLVNDSRAATPAKYLVNMFLVPARWDISPVYSAADMLVVRGGASTLSEVKATQIPAVVIPWSAAAGDHQRKNAMLMDDPERVRVWDENRGSIDELTGLLRGFELFRPASGDQITEKMYNLADAICERLWNFMASNGIGLCALKGDDNIGG
ncbi:MAG: UDP-N-acetylglucosamine--N-acetylmuramyl-(pentapeptide) pyrophosphoryl-undecaprenol N-acetylglucosamine transferase [Synergistaceae bacterium]|nr:UDP-N-acetylglucosamine--N-acetylmuramyl-(pentapeptide) pyrophosphoryl-undecaprenol N-acetylglucosamine transferase [Synergistaceae bacterium]